MLLVNVAGHRDLKGGFISSRDKATPIARTR